jgi:hypothetical protein
MTVRDGAPNKTCTGTIIARNWVLTAGHCVVAETAAGTFTTTTLPTSRVRITLDRDGLRRGRPGSKWAVDRIALYPGFTPRDKVVTGDVALLHLATTLPADALPIPLAPRSWAPPEGSMPTAYGYGLTSESYNSPGPTKRSGSSARYLFATAGGAYVRQSSCDATELTWCMRWTGGSEVLSGDSGGPWVEGVSPFQFGLTSFNQAFGYTGTHTGHWHYHQVARLSGTVHDWITDTAAVVQGVAGQLYRDAGTGAAWLRESDGFLHHIADGTTYRCLTANGARVVSLDSFDLTELPVADAGNASCGSAARILLYGDGGAGTNTTGFGKLATALTASGFAVTSLTGRTSLPTDISSYAEIWHYGIDAPTGADRQRLIGFAKAGGGVLLTGERPCCETENAADAVVVNALVGAAGRAGNGRIGVGGRGDVGACGDNETVNPTSDVSRYPNALTTWHPQCPGGLSNVARADVLASASDGTPVAAAWGSHAVLGGGKLVLLMDVNWAQSNYADPATMPAVAQNLAAFLR